MNYLFLILATFLLSSCMSPNEIFSHGIGRKGEISNGSYLFSEGRGNATRLFIITSRGTDVRQGDIKFSSGDNEAVVGLSGESRGIVWDGQKHWGSWVNDEHIVGKEVYVVFLKKILKEFPENQPILVKSRVFPKDSDFYLWGNSKWDAKKIE